MPGRSPARAAVALAFAVALACPACAGVGEPLLTAEEAFGTPGDRALGLGELAFDLAPLSLDGTDAAAAGDAAEAPVRPVPRGRPLLDKKSAWFSAGVLAVTPVLSYFAWWRNDSSSRFTWEPEGWFGESGYAGGADKASHIVFAWIGQDLLQRGYEALGRTPREARVLSVGMVAAAGLLIETGDGFSKYGASWEDAVTNAVGAAAGAAVDAAGLRDTIGMRLGLVKALVPDPCCRYGGYGTDYSRQIYTLDLKWNGLLKRNGVRPGLARFLLTSVSYNSKGYRYSDVPVRQRNIGFEVGLNVAEVVRAVGVKDESWWGGPLLYVLEHFRFPYSSFGVYWDVNHWRWHGFHTGDRFDPGSIIYD